MTPGIFLPHQIEAIRAAVNIVAGIACADDPIALERCEEIARTALRVATTHDTYDVADLVARVRAEIGEMHPFAS